MRPPLCTWVESTGLCLAESVDPPRNRQRKAAAAPSAPPRFLPYRSVSRTTRAPAAAALAAVQSDEPLSTTMRSSTQEEEAHTYSGRYPAPGDRGTYSPGQSLADLAHEQEQGAVHLPDHGVRGQSRPCRISLGSIGDKEVALSGTQPGDVADRLQVARMLHDHDGRMVGLAEAGGTGGPDRAAGTRPATTQQSRMYRRQALFMTCIPLPCVHRPRLPRHGCPGRQGKDPLRAPF